MGFISGLESINVPHMVSNMSQWMIKEMLSDDEFVKNYIEENRKMITRNYRLVVAAFKSLKVPFISSSGGIFVWMIFLGTWTLMVMDMVTRIPVL